MMSYYQLSNAAEDLCIMMGIMFNLAVFKTLYEDCIGGGCPYMVLTVWWATFGGDYNRINSTTPISAAYFFTRYCNDARPECDTGVLSSKEFVRQARQFGLIPANTDDCIIDAVRQCWEDDGITFKKL